MTTVDEMQKLAKDNAENATKAFGTLSKGLQAIAVEITDFSKKSFEDSASTLEQLAGAKTLDKVVEIQADYAKKAYEALVAQTTKVGELYVDLAKEVAKPFEALIPKAPK
ncbi:phasin family protein [Siculibacillus lacustris]|uniref:Phasin family protein n=1 Tax=Siculibacillus lacustris TaxID=1549641 RepID=A0A4Q9VGK1_9HYPH|nr:phasin family protein [Siculibacillus lacustris]TBW34041.1 phasin family protein [Siculibacillus lacustris]